MARDSSRSADLIGNQAGHDERVVGFRHDAVIDKATVGQALEGVASIAVVRFGLECEIACNPRCLLLYLKRCAYRRESV